MTPIEKAAHFYRTDVETIENFVKAVFSTDSIESRYIIIEIFLERHTDKVCKQTIDELFDFLKEYCKEKGEVSK